MSDREPLRPPRGAPPPSTATLPEGVELALRPLAVEVTDEHLRRHPEDLERYGEPGRDWCTHDNQHLLHWAVLDLRGELSFTDQLAWLANVLDSRGYPLANLADNLEAAAGAVRRRVSGTDGEELAERLQGGAASLRVA